MQTQSIALSIVLAAAAVPSLAQSAGNAQLTTDQSEEFGAYVSDRDGRALYMFTTDTRGEGDSQASSSCYDACAQAWPPLIATGEPKAGDELDQTLIGTAERKDGQSQVTYGGWPLYYFVQDSGAGMANGQDKHGFGGGWYLITPDGEKIDKEE